MSAPRRLAADADGADEQRRVAAAVETLSPPELVPQQRRGLVAQLASQAAAVVPRWRPRAALRWAGDTLTDVTPYLPVRDAATLRLHHPGLDGDLLADRLIRNAARATAGVGAACGGIAAVNWTIPPTLLASPVLLGAETVAVAAIEVKLLAELHQVYRVPVPGTGPEHTMALLQSWAQQRGVDPAMSGAGLGAVLGTAARHRLRDRIARRFSRNLTTFGPLLTGAAVASVLNQRATRAVGRRVQDDLRGSGWPRGVPGRAS